MFSLAILGFGHSLRSSRELQHADFGEPEWWIAAGISVVLVLFAGIMSGLTLGLMSLGLVDLEVLQQSGSEAEKKQASTILPVVQKQHQLLVTLLLCNAAAMEALPIFLDDMLNEFVAVLLSVTLVLAFGEVIPQAVCSKHGLAIGANLIWLVKILMIVCWPVSYPVGKMLDHLLGHNDSGVFRRTQLKALVGIHGKAAGKGGDLTHDETTIIQGALDLTEKTALDSMTPLETTFSLDVNTRLNRETIDKIMARGHSRIPVYDGDKRNIVGVLLVKSLLSVRAEEDPPISSVTIRRIPSVPSSMPLYDILNEFQKGSHMAAVTKVKTKTKESSSDGDKTMNQKPQGSQRNGEADLEKGVQDEASKEVRIMKVEEDAFGHVDAGEVIGIITLEDVMEELLQEEIVDETDEFIDVANRVRVAAAAAQLNRGASLVRSIGSFKNPQMGISKQGQQAIQKVRQAEKEARQNRLAQLGMDGSNDVTEPLLDRK
ncbi:hypothetical protein M758_8G128200 [Ceratodon purpureus]|nr:hypothetical protein M758_8G128200 [Ceratodon purpureus]